MIARFMSFCKPGVTSIPDHVLLQLFWLGLNNDTAQQFDITTGGSFAYKTTSEGVKLLDHILENTSFTELLPVIQLSSQEEVSIAEPVHSLVTLSDPGSGTAHRRRMF